METKPETTISQDIIESLIINGDLTKLNQAQKIEYYTKYCTALGLNPMTQPFSLLLLNGKQKLYCSREGVAQLSKVHNVSHEIVSTETVNGVFLVKIKASCNGRYTTSTGAVSIDNIKGDVLCNAMMKAETKAKRRSTLDLLGLGILDEVEVSTIPGAKTEDIEHTEVMTVKKAIEVLMSSQNLIELAENWGAVKDVGKNPDVIAAKEQMKVNLTPVKEQAS